MKTSILPQTPMPEHERNYFFRDEDKEEYLELKKFMDIEKTENMDLYQIGRHFVKI